MAAYLTACPRCDSDVVPGAGVCDRCQATFDPWVDRPARVSQLLGADADALERGLDFPTVARHLAEVNRLVDRHETSVQDMVAVIVRDLALTTDFRAVFSEVLQRHLGASDLSRIFPGYDSHRLDWPGVLRPG